MNPFPQLLLILSTVLRISLLLPVLLKILTSFNSLTGRKNQPDQVVDCISCKLPKHGHWELTQGPPKLMLLSTEDVFRVYPALSKEAGKQKWSSLP